MCFSVPAVDWVPWVELKVLKRRSGGLAEPRIARPYLNISWIDGSANDLAIGFLCFPSAILGLICNCLPDDDVRSSRRVIAIKDHCSLSKGWTGVEVVLSKIPVT